MIENKAIEHHHGEKSGPIGEVWGPACNYPEGSNTCLTIKRLANDVYSVHVGIDISMSRQDAQTYYDGTNGYPLIAYLMKYEAKGPALDPLLFNISKTLTLVGDSGLGAEFEVQVGSRALDINDGRDRVYAKVVLIDPHGNRAGTYTSGVINAFF